jgi:hypothetical protein
MRADSLEVIILKQREIEKNCSNTKEQLKDNRRKVRNSFLKAQLQA